MCIGGGQGIAVIFERLWSEIKLAKTAAILRLFFYELKLVKP
jgi:hypothetical protein